MHRVNSKRGKEATRLELLQNLSERKERTKGRRVGSLGMFIYVCLSVCRLACMYASGELEARQGGHAA